MREATIQRPVTIAKLAEVLVTKPYRILSVLIRRSVFPAPCDSIDDSVAMEVASLAGVDLKIIDDEDGGASASAVGPDVPVPPPDSSSASDRIQDAQQAGTSNGG
jgi:hypothetical protein